MRLRDFVLGVLAGWLSVVLFVGAFLLIAREKIEAGAAARDREATSKRIENMVLRPPLLDPQELGTFDYSWRVEWGAAGESGDFEAYRGRVVVLTIWASWCLPCLAEFPKLAELASQFPDDEVAVISLSADPADQFETFIAKGEFEPPGRVARLGTQGSSQLWPHGLPTTWVVSRSGEIVIRHAGAADWSAPSVVDFVRKLATADQSVANH